MVEGARLESVCAGNRTEGSNPFLSAKLKSPEAFLLIGSKDSVNHLEGELLIFSVEPALNDAS